MLPTMEKPVPTDLPLHELLRRRYSPRALSDRTVTDQELRVLFEAARWSASCNNEQPWRFIVASRANRTSFDRMNSVLLPGNQAWASHAAVLVLGVASMQFSRNGKDNLHAFYDLGQAVANLTVQATSMDLFVHQMAGYDRDKARELYNIPDGFEPAVAFAIGYLGDPDALPEKLREREHLPRTRKPLDEIVFADEWPAS